MNNAFPNYLNHVEQATMVKGRFHVERWKCSPSPKTATLICDNWEWTASGKGLTRQARLGIDYEKRK